MAAAENVSSVVTYDDLPADRALRLEITASHAGRRLVRHVDLEPGSDFDIHRVLLDAADEVTKLVFP